MFKEHIKRSGFVLPVACLLSFVITSGVVGYIHIVLSNFNIIKHNGENIEIKKVVQIQKDRIEGIEYEELKEDLEQKGVFEIKEGEKIEYQITVGNEKIINGEEYKIVGLTVKNKNTGVEYEEKIPISKNNKNYSSNSLGKSEDVDFINDSRFGNYHRYDNVSAIADKNGIVTCFSSYQYPGQPSNLNLYQTRIFLADKSGRRKGDYVSLAGNITFPVNIGDRFGLWSPLIYSSRPFCSFTSLSKN